MAATSQSDFAAQMVAQLRALDPAISAEIGTPERKIIDTVAQVLAETQVDITVLNGALNLDTKYGDSLDKFLQVLGFARQSSTFATGFVKFSRPTASTLNIVIPAGTQVYAPAITDPDTAVSTNTLYATTFGVTLLAGQTSVTAPIQAILPGVNGNVDVGRITAFANAVPNGVTQISNEQPTAGGIDQETDDEFKIRFKNTVFRNLAGTYDQYLALAVSTQFTTKANVIGPISRYREYIQVPSVDDASTDTGTNLPGNGVAGQYTTALSTLPYSKYTYDSVPYFVSNGKFGVQSLFYRQDTDFVMNTTNKNRGDAYREYVSGSGTDPLNSPNRPNVTLLNVYTGIDPSIQSIRPNDIILFEHSYVSTESRNDPLRNINNAVDIYIDGGNLITTNAVIPKPTTATPFTTLPSDKFYYENFRRVGEPNRRPLVGNIFTALFWQPTLSLPPEIIVGETSYYRDIHYFAVEDVSSLRGTVRARNGIEWATNVPGLSSDDQEGGPYTGPKITANPESSVTVSGYQYDKNISDLQTSIEGARQITTDVLAHTARKKYFKLDITLMYSQGSGQDSVNASIRTEVDRFLASQYYGQVIQMSDLLAVIHNTAGVDNVRWSSDLLTTRHKVVECDYYGNPLLNCLVDRVAQGTLVSSEVQQYYITGNPTGGTYKIAYNNQTSQDIPYSADVVGVQAALTAASIPATVTGLGQPGNPFVLTFTGNGAKNLITITPSFTGGATVYNSDFFLKDDELPQLTAFAVGSDTLPGLKIRPRSQSTWQTVPS